MPVRTDYATLDILTMPVATAVAIVQPRVLGKDQKSH